jgi:hypothetical protein
MTACYFVQFGTARYTNMMHLENGFYVTELVWDISLAWFSGVLYYSVSLVWIHKRRNRLELFQINFSFPCVMVWFWGGSRTIDSLNTNLHRPKDKRRSFWEEREAACH